MIKKSTLLSIKRVLRQKSFKVHLRSLHDDQQQHKQQQQVIHQRPPQNEPLLDYRCDPKSKHRLELDKCIEEFRLNCKEIPIVINGKRYEGTGNWRYQYIPFEHKHKMAKFRYADPKLVWEAIKVCEKTRNHWDSHTTLESRCELFEKAANLASSTKYRQLLTAATILGQAKTVEQAEIDAGCELTDFLRFNAYYARKLLEWSQPISPKPKEVINSLDFRSLDGFVAAISPFNFTAIGANLATAPSLMGNCVVWKPSDSSILSNYLTFQLLEEAGFPPGVINFVPSDGFQFGRIVTGQPTLAGINFTGSLATFRWLWSEVGLNMNRFETFPRLLGECGGKNFHFVHQSADPDLVVAQTIRSAFEYSGQKCSACSRLFVPASLWKNEIKEKLCDIAANKLTLGPASDFDSTYLSAVIDSRSFKRIEDIFRYVESHPDDYKLLTGGKTHGQEGYYVEPTIIECQNANSRLMEEEIFGPVLSVYVYPDSETNKTLALVDKHKFALTGSVFAQDQAFIERAKSRLRMAAGNFYINDKSTGAVVGQQPFGGSRLSGTNDKAGGAHNLMRWCNQRTIKRTLKPIRQWSNMSIT